MPNVDVRCPIGPQRLFTRLKFGEESSRYIQPGNLIEFSCSDCSRRATRERGTPVRVFHRYNFLGEHVETTTEEQGS